MISPPLNVDTQKWQSTSAIFWDDPTSGRYMGFVANGDTHKPARRRNRLASAFRTLAYGISVDNRPYLTATVGTASPFALMYVFDYRATSGYLCRVPHFLARIITRLTSGYDYAPTAEGLG